MNKKLPEKYRIALLICGVAWFFIFFLLLVEPIQEFPDVVTMSIIYFGWVYPVYWMITRSYGG